MENIPKKIFLNHGLTNSEMEDVDFNDLSEVTWSQFDTNGNDLIYYHESVINRLKEEQRSIIKSLKLILSSNKSASMVEFNLSGYIDQIESQNKQQ